MLTVFIDGENFRQNLSKLLAEAGIISDKDDIFRYDIRGLLSDVLSDVELDIRYYASEIKTPKGYTPTKNIQKQLTKIKEKCAGGLLELKTKTLST